MNKSRSCLTRLQIGAIFINRGHEAVEEVTDICLLLFQKIFIIGRAVAAVHIHHGEIRDSLLRIVGRLVTEHRIGLAAVVEVTLNRDKALVGKSLFRFLRVFAVGDVDLGHIIAVVCCRRCVQRNESDHRQRQYQRCDRSDAFQ